MNTPRVVENLSQRQDALGLSPTLVSAGHRTSLRELEISPEALKLLPADFVKRNRILPFKLSNGTIHIATDQPGNAILIDDIRLLTGMEVAEIEAPSAELLQKIAECYQVTVEQMIENLSPGKSTAGETRKLHELAALANSA